MISKKVKIFIPAIFILLGCFSCGTVLKWALRMKTPKALVSDQDRTAFYRPFTEKKPYYNSLKIYTLSDTATFTDFLSKSRSFPMILIKNIQTDSIYSLSCFEDITWDIENIHENDFTYLTPAAESVYQDLFSLLEPDKSVVWYQTTSDINKDDYEWDVYLGSGIFLGKKLRRLILPVTELKNIREFNIIDLSSSE